MTRSTDTVLITADRYFIRRLYYKTETERYARSILSSTFVQRTGFGFIACVVMITVPVHVINGKAEGSATES